MTTAAVLVKQAFREGNLIEIGKTPTTAEAAEGLDTLNTLMSGVFGVLVGNNLRDWSVPRGQSVGQINRDYPLLPGADLPLAPTYTMYPPQNSRVVWNTGEAHIYLPNDPLSDGALFGLVRGSGAGFTPGTLTIDGNGHLIGGSDTVDVTLETYTPGRWFYRADLGNWVPVVPMAATDESLFPFEFDDTWICGLSIRLAPRFGKEVAKSTALRFTEMMGQLRSRYQQTEPTGSGGEITVPGVESYDTGQYWWWGSLT